VNSVSESRVVVIYPQLPEHLFGKSGRTAAIRAAVFNISLASKSIWRKFGSPVPYRIPPTCGKWYFASHWVTSKAQAKSGLQD